MALHVLPKTATSAAAWLVFPITPLRSSSGLKHNIIIDIYAHETYITSIQTEHERYTRALVMTTKRRKIEIEWTLSQMTLEELLRLRGMIDSYIASAEEERLREEERERRIELGLEEPAHADNGLGEKSQGSKGGGYVELKMINGCGPYAYQRARVGGRLTSEYIGKVKQ